MYDSTRIRGSPCCGERFCMSDMRLLSLFQCFGESAHSCTDGAWLKFRCIRCTITCTVWTDVGDLSVLEQIQQERHQQCTISRFITSISFDLTIQFLQTHALRSAEIPSAVVTVVTLAMSRHGPPRHSHQERPHTPQADTVLHQTSEGRTTQCVSAAPRKDRSCCLVALSHR